MKRIILFGSILFLTFIFRAEAQLIKDKDRLANIEKQFVIQQDLAKARSSQLFSVFQQNLSLDEEQALKFLFAYMPLSDLADYDGQFFLDNVRMSLKARNEMPWGKNIPEDIFLHFVLPVRVGNENLDSFRIVMYHELKNRITGLSMRQAALEINHWCHEKVTYKASDARTSSPLSTIRYSLGRCGEESVLTVAAMRTAGIPARQVYTPRWAHCDDNHAWVEVWVDDKWNFLGACEPQPDLNMSWFERTATRTMLVHSRDLGWYNGPEPCVSRGTNFSELNVTSNYAPTKNLIINVIDDKLQPVADAKVEYQLYNYAEFFPIAKTYTDGNGLTSISLGLGDIIVWANKGNLYGYKKITVETTDTLTIKISSASLNGKVEEFDFVPPVEREPFHASKVNDSKRLENDRRLLYEDSLRAAYMATFKDSLWAAGFAKKLGINVDSTVSFVTKSYGNWKEITTFLESVTPELKPFALKLLSVISEKDLRDTKATILSDYLHNAMKYYKDFRGNEDIWEKYVLSGRVANEMMVSSQELYQLNRDLKLSPTGIREEILKKIKIDNAANAFSRAPLTPVGVLELQIADQKSRDIFFVAMCRASGCAARLQPETLVPQFWTGKEWEDVVWDTVQMAKQEKGYVHFLKQSSFEPKYNIHFTLALFGDGVYRTLQFEEEKPIGKFAPRVEVPAGNYMLVTGNRQQDGSVLCRVSYFEIKPGETKEVAVKVRDLQIAEQPWGKLESGSFDVKPLGDGKNTKLSQLTNSKPFVIIFIEPDKEPTKHVMADIQAMRDHFEKWAGSIIFALQPGKTSPLFNPAMFPGLPSQSIFVWDNDGNLLQQIGKLKSTSLENDLPVIISGDEKENLFYFSKGYRIGVGEQLVKRLK